MSPPAAPRLSVELVAKSPRGGWAPLVDKLDTLLASGYPPGLALAVLRRRGAVFTAWGGFARVVGVPEPLRRSTLFDLASLTKVVATVPLALLLAERGEWRLDDPVWRWLPGYPRREVTLLQLLTHTSGLIPHRPFFESLRGKAAIRRAVFAEAAGAAPPGAVCYSDLNFMLLGWALEACRGERLDHLVRAALTEPLGMTRTRFVPPPGERPLCAATELNGDQRLEPGLIQGVVHDGNAAALGGIAGHAGLFAPLDDLVVYATALLNPASHPVLSPASLGRLGRRTAASDADVRSIGWRLSPSGWGSWPDGTYWHTGFTGTSLLVSPRRGAAVVLLMNGVHPRRRPDAQARVRAAVHVLVDQALR